MAGITPTSETAGNGVRPSDMAIWNWIPGQRIKWTDTEIMASNHILADDVVRAGSLIETPGNGTGSINPT